MRRNIRKTFIMIGLGADAIPCQYRKSHFGDESILRPYNLQNGISYTGKMTSLYWIRALIYIELKTIRGQPHWKTTSIFLSFRWHQGNWILIQLIIVLFVFEIATHYLQRSILSKCFKCSFRYFIQRYNLRHSLFRWQKGRVKELKTYYWYKLVHFILFYLYLHYMPTNILIRDCPYKAEHQSSVGQIICECFYSLTILL